jgi:hypothetical protein
VIESIDLPYGSPSRFTVRDGRASMAREVLEIHANRRERISDLVRERRGKLANGCE